MALAVIPAAAVAAGAMEELFLLALGALAAPGVTVKAAVRMVPAGAAELVVIQGSAELADQARQ